MRQKIFRVPITALCVAHGTSFVTLGAEADADDTANRPAAEQPELTESVVVRAIRADDEAPVTKTNITREELVERNRGQEMPFLLQSVPSVTLYSDSGAAAGYSYIYLRGLQHTRINFTFDGVPLNEPEDCAAYFADYANLAASVQGVQVQRGVGTSNFGAASFAGGRGKARVLVARLLTATLPVTPLALVLANR